jgi:hypothetical protein
MFCYIVHCATSRKVAGSIPNEVVFFSWPNPSSRKMALRSTQPLMELRTRNLPRGKGRLALKADNLTGISESIVQKMRKPRRLTNIWASTACYRDSFIFLCRRLTIDGCGMNKSLSNV